MNWNQWIEANESKRMTCQKCPQPLSFFPSFIWNGALATVSCTFCRPQLPKVARTRQFFYDFFVKSSSRYSLVHIFVDLIFNKWPDPVNFLTFLCEIELSLQSRAHCIDLIFNKCSETVSFLRFYVKLSSRYGLVHILSTSSSKSGPDPSVFFTISLWNRALATISCTFLSTSSSISGPILSIF